MSRRVTTVAPADEDTESYLRLMSPEAQRLLAAYRLKQALKVRKRGKADDRQQES